VPLTLLTPRWIALHIAMVAVVVVFLALGLWQFGVYRDSEARQDQRDLAPVELAELTSAGRDLGAAAERAVTAAGSYVPAASLTVPARVHEGVLGSYTVGVLRTSHGYLPVLRGWVEDAAAPSTVVPSGQVRVTGHLLPPETSRDAADPDADLPAGQIGFVAPQQVADETNIDPNDLFGGYLVLSSEEPRPETAPEPLELAVVEPIRHVSPLQNLSYWALWWVFAGAVAVFWFSSARAAARGRDRVSRG
jgi:cytochrome oxidase assembly protein ShyY1